MIKYEIEGAESLLKLLKQKTRVYKLYKRRILRNASKLGLKITQDKWFGIDDEVNITLSMTNNGFIITASGTQVLFLEFGAGKTYASTKHPLADKFKYGPGTYNEDSDNWKNPDGWYYYSDDPTKVMAFNMSTGRGIAHTYGNVAWAASYKSALIMREEFKAMVIKELLRK